MTFKNLILGFFPNYRISHLFGILFCCLVYFFSQKVFPGNSNAKDMIKQNLEEPVLALFVRVVPKEWENWPCMRVEVYGKPASKYREIPSS